MSTPRDDRRFVAIVNDAIASSRLDLSAAPDPLDPGYIAAWAAFVRACVARGVEVGDPRWARLTVRLEDDQPRFRLTDDSAPRESESEDEPDFGVGLALLMSLLGRNKGKS